MSRSNPYKKKRRVAEKSILLFGEGLTEEQFLKFLRNIYSPNRNINVKILKGSGGSPEQVVIQASRVPGDFNRRIAVVDTDKGDKELNKAKTTAKRLQIEIHTQTPCLEGLILSIIDEKQEYSVKKSSWCKDKLETYFKTKNKQFESEDFGKILKKPLLEKKRKTILELNRIILLLEGY